MVRLVVLRDRLANALGWVLSMPCWIVNWFYRRHGAFHATNSCCLFEEPWSFNSHSSNPKSEFVGVEITTKAMRSCCTLLSIRRVRLVPLQLELGNAHESIQSHYAPWSIVVWLSGCFIVKTSCSCMLRCISTKASSLVSYKKKGSFLALWTLCWKWHVVVAHLEAGRFHRLGLLAWGLIDAWMLHGPVDWP